MLKCEQNTKAMERRVMSAAVKRFGRKRGMSTWFEHGQWWVVFTSGAQYSVVDAEGGPAIDGFDFEKVRDSDED